MLTFIKFLYVFGGLYPHTPIQNFEGTSISKQTKSQSNIAHVNRYRTIDNNGHKVVLPSWDVVTVDSPLALDDPCIQNIEKQYQAQWLRIAIDIGTYCKVI